jgi:hypothetical protein
MDLFLCPACGSVFWAPSEASNERRCPECDARLDLSASGPTTVPLEARLLDGDWWDGSAPRMVVLRRKRAGRIGDRIVRDLGDYFDIAPSGSAVEVSVKAAVVAPPAVLVAAVLDGIDEGWEEHFHLPVLLIQQPSPEAINGGM